MIAAALAAGVLGFPWHGCTDSVGGAPTANAPPRTFIWTDTLNLVQTSQVTIYWWGDDPDGFVKGYLVSVAGSPWAWTTSQESTFSVTLGGVDSILAAFRVSAVDAAGNGRWDPTVTAGGINFGAEPYVDRDSNGVYTPGEFYVDLGAIDPTPAFLNVAVKNSPPKVGFVQNTTIPSTTLPVATFLISGTDVDGDETIARYFIALNDTSAGNWVEIPGSVTLLTLSGDLSNPAATTVNAQAFSGTGLTDLAVTVPNMRLNANNVLWIYGQDLAGAKSSVSRMPDTTKTWFVKKPAGRRKLLLIDDFSGGSPNPDVVYGSALQTALDGSGTSFGDYDVVDLQTSPIPAPLHIPMLLGTMRQYPMVFWYARIANLSYAQNTLPSYLNGGGKVLMTTGFQNFVDPLGLALDFAPIDSLVTQYTDSAGNARSGYISRVYANSVVNSADTVRYPRMVFSQTAIFGFYAVVPTLGDSVIYRLDLPKNPPNTQELWIGTPAVGVRSQKGDIIFLTFPLHLMDTVHPQGFNRLVRLFERVLRDDFGG